MRNGLEKNERGKQEENQGMAQRKVWLDLGRTEPCKQEKSILRRKYKIKK